MFCSCRISTDKRLARSLCNSRVSCLKWRPSSVLDFLDGSSKSPTRLYIFTARRHAKRGICRRLVSVCLPATLLRCIKTDKHRITQIMPHDSPVTLVFRHQSTRRNSNGITPYGATNAGGVG